MAGRWTTQAQLDAALATFREALPGWVPPQVYAAGLSSASSSAETDFPHVTTDVGPGRGELPALVLAHVVGHRSGTATYPVTTAQLDRCVEALAPAEGVPGLEHPNLWAWRDILAELDGNPMRAAYVVFIGSLDDPVSSEQDGSLRTLLHSREGA